MTIVPGIKQCVTVLAGLLAFQAAAISPALKELEDAFVQLHERVRPTVVNIDADTKINMSDSEQMQQYNDLFKLFGMPPEGQRDQTVPSQGSGFIYDKQGHIITNNHVVENATSLKVRLWNGDEYKATVVGRDSQTDLAVIKIEPKGDLPVAALGDSDTVRVGQFAIAVGSPQGLEGSMSFGHVSALGRSNLSLPNLRFQNFIQTDAAINLGNSGGPLVDIDGNVIGINTAIVFGAESLGFATNINMAKKIVPVLIAEGRIRRGFLGVQINDAKDFADAEGLTDKSGAYVVEVRPDTPAERAGIQNYDIIRKVNGDPVKGAADLQGKISDVLPGAPVTLEVWRNKEVLQVAVNLAEFEDEVVETKVEKSKVGLRVIPLPSEDLERFRLEPGTTGVIVEAVEPGSPAYEAGIRPGDLITEIAKQKVTSVDDFNALMDQYAKPDESIIVRVLRQGNQILVVIKVGAAEAEKP